MVTVFRVPKLGLTMDEAVVHKWHKNPGDAVAEGEPVLDVETDKAVLDVESPVTGYLRKQLARPGDRVPLGGALAIFSTDPGEDISSFSPIGEVKGSQAAAQAQAPSRPLAAAKEAVPQVPAGDGRFRASPAIRRRAQAEGIDVAELVGSGPRGRIRMQDLERALAAREHGRSASPAGEPRVMSKARRTTAMRMVQSAREIPQFTLRRKVDMGEIVRLRALVNRSMSAGGATLSVTDFLLQALAHGIMEHEVLRSALVGDLQDGRMAVAPVANIGLAVESRDGLLVPVLSEVESLSLIEIARLRKDAVGMAREGRLAGKFMQTPSFTLSNLGTYGVDEFHALVNPGEAGILAVGRLQEDTVSLPGGSSMRHTLVLTFTFDHRLIDGADGARFAASVAGTMESDTWRLA